MKCSLEIGLRSHTQTCRSIGSSLPSTPTRSAQTPAAAARSQFDNTFPVEGTPLLCEPSSEHNCGRPDT